MHQPNSEAQNLAHQNAELELEIAKLRAAPPPAPVAVTPTQTVAPAAPSTTPAPKAEIAPPTQSKEVPFLFSAFPAQIKQADTSKLPFKVENWAISADKTQINVRFNLLYTLTDGGHQQGRIVIVARGPGILLAHPYAVIQESSAGFLINPEAGEFFSVGKFREVRAEFPIPDSSLLSSRRIQEIQAFLFSQKGELLYQRTESVEARNETRK